MTSPGPVTEPTDLGLVRIRGDDVAKVRFLSIGAGNRVAIRAHLRFLVLAITLERGKIDEMMLEFSSSHEIDDFLQSSAGISASSKNERRHARTWRAFASGRAERLRLRLRNSCHHGLPTTDTPGS